MAKARMTDARTANVRTKMPAKGGLRYQSGFGNEFASEAVEGVLPRGQNAPQKVAHGLYTEQLSGTAFTAPRGVNRRTWLYRMRPSVAQSRFSRSSGEGCAARRSTRCRRRRTSCAGVQFRSRLPLSTPTSLTV